MKITDLFEDSKYPYTWNEKNIIWDNGLFFIAVNNTSNPTYFTIWTDENKKIGVLALSPITKKQEKWMKVDTVDIDSKYRGNGLGVEVYRQALNVLPDDVKGIYSYLPNRSNTKQVPKIYKKLGGYVKDGDHAFLPKPKV
jgi:predicted GNAT family N-acyltransferase